MVHLKHMKNIIVRLVVVGAFLPMLAFAQTVTDTVSDQIDCAVITHALKLGSRDASTGGDVTTLQIYLSQANYLDVDPTGYFGRATKKAVQDFQSANGITSLGNVGPYTRTKIKEISCTDSNTNTSANTPITSTQAVVTAPSATVNNTTTNYNTYTAPAVTQQYTKMPSCTISTDKYSYNVGDKITFSYSSEGATYATWIKDASGKDNLYVPGDKLATSGIYTTTATVSGNPSVTLGVYGIGGYGTCSKVVPVSSAVVPVINYFNTTNTSVNSGTGVTVRWSSADAANCNLGHTENNSTTADGNSIGTASEYTIYPTKSALYTLSCFGASTGGKDVQAAIKNFNVTVTAVAPLPTCQVSQQTTSASNNTPFTISWTSTNAAYGVSPSGDKINVNGSVTYQLSQGEEKKYDFTFFNSEGKSTTCSTFFSSMKG